MNESQQLITQIQSGDHAAVDALLERHLPDLQAFIRVRCGPLIRARESSADILQSTCREILEHLERFRYRGEAQFRRWLYETAMRKLIDRKRYYRAAKRDALREVPPPERSTAERDANAPAIFRDLHTPSQDAMANEQRERLERALDQLDANERELYALFQIVGMSSSEIARERGSSEVAVRKQKSRLLTKISRLMAP